MTTEWKETTAQLKEKTTDLMRGELTLNKFGVKRYSVNFA